METMKVENIKIACPFDGLFSINPLVLARVQEDMEKRGYDPSQPINLWREGEVMIDGHTRLEAARRAGLEEIPIHYQSFDTEDAALTYAIHNQRHRRNLTDEEILRCIEALDRRKTRGGDHKSDTFKEKSKAPNGAIDRKEKSARRTAKLVGVSTRKVERARTVLADPQAAAEVSTGKKKISRAYKEIQANRKSQSKPEPAQKHDVERRTILQQALKEIQPWQEKYRDYPELSAIFTAIDGCRLDLEQKELVPQAEEATKGTESREPCSPACVEEDGEESPVPSAVNEGLSKCHTTVDTNAETGPFPDETSTSEPEGQAADSETSGRVGDNLKKCSDCRNFKTNPEESGPKVTCEIYPKFFWAGEPVSCPHFKPRDSTDDPSPGILEKME